MLEKFENEAFFLWLGLSTTLIRHNNEAFPKRGLHENHIPSTEFSSKQIQNDR